MALTPAEKQRRYRERQRALQQRPLDHSRLGFLQEAERCERGKLSDQAHRQ
jgi:hypothetical protein